MANPKVGFGNLRYGQRVLTPLKKSSIKVNYPALNTLMLIPRFKMQIPNWRHYEGYRRLRAEVSRFSSIGRWLLWLVFSLGLPRLAVAVIVYSTGDPAHNTTAPT